MANEKPTKKEIEEAKEKRRGYALKNLKAGSLLNLATSYFTQADKNYGEHDNSAVEEFLYRQAIKGVSAYNLDSGEESDLVYDSLLGSRQDGKRYSGHVSEYDIIKTGALIVQQSLEAVKVEDLMDLIGSGINVLDIGEVYQNKYVSDLLQSENKKDKEVAQTLIGGYSQYLATQGVSRALGLRAAAIRGGLEKIVNEEQEK